MQRPWHDPKCLSNDSFHRVLVNEEKVSKRAAQGYRVVVQEDGEPARFVVGSEAGKARYGVLMEIPQVDYQAMVSPKPPGMLPGEVLWSMTAGGRIAYPPDDWDGDVNDEIDRHIYGPHGTFKPQGQPIRDWHTEPPADNEPWSGRPILGFLPTRQWSNPWNPWRILHFPGMGEPLNGLFNWTRGYRWRRLAW